MKNRNVYHRKAIPTLLLALVLGCFSLSSAVLADKPNNGNSIVGIWRVVYSGDLVFESFDQFHSDGLEIEVSNILGVSCQGVFKQRADGTVKLFHTGWNFDANGALIGYFNQNQRLTVSTNGQNYDGTWVLQNYDVNGNQLDQQTGTVHATRLSVNTPL
ncbi:MAG: hypothetical protein M3429_01100 [Verrucomicrobiota bacterium]|nr:hypothetical protein [Chthoniobacterales bacterium]MDQ3545109.1 hypothetical protein [Verrucomicrobiota bacterium]